MATKREAGGRIHWEFGFNRYTLLYMKLINKFLLYSTDIQCLVMIYNEKNAEKKIYMNHFAVF